MGKLKSELNGATLVVEKTKVKKPPLYKVLLHNDDYTPMDFVVMILEGIFQRNHADAVEIMLSVHKKGIGVCGIYTHEIAESKMLNVLTLAKENEYPLQCTIEPE